MATQTYPKTSMTLLDWQQMGVIIRPDGVELGGAVTLLGGRGVRLGVTKVWVGGLAGINDANLDLTSTVNGSVNPRYDRLIARLSMPTGTVTFTIISGPAAVAPSAPPLTRVLGGTWEYSIAYWLVPGTGGPGVSNYNLVNEGLKPTLNPTIAYGGIPIFNTVTERDAAYVGAGLGAMITGMHCYVLGSGMFIYNGSGWAQDLPPYGPIVVANIAAAVGLPEGTFFYANDVDRFGVVTSGGPNFYLQGVIRQVLKADFNAAGSTLSGAQNLMTQAISVLQHSLVKFEVSICIKSTAAAAGTLTIGLTGAPSETITWDSHGLATLVQKRMTIEVRSPGVGVLSATLDCVTSSGTGITLHEVPWVIRETT